MSLKSRTALVTGANRDMGIAVARALIEAGHRVALGSRDPGRELAAPKSLEAGERAGVAGVGGEE